MDLRETARQYLAWGLCALPASPVTKFTTLPRWKTYQKKRMSDRQIEANFLAAEGVCLICGMVSDGLEMIDFDQSGRAYESWATAVELRCPGLLDTMVVERSLSGGRHVYYRCEAPRKNTTLAASGTFKEPKKLIETRGEGGLVVCAPTPGYELIRGNFGSIPVIGENFRETLWELAAGLTEVVRPTPSYSNGSAFDLDPKRVDAYLATCPPAVSKHHGHDVTFAIARSIVWGFDLDIETALHFLGPWNETCQPPWSDKELRHKVNDANTKPYNKPRGYLRDAENPRWEDSSGVDLSGFNLNGSAEEVVEDETDEPERTSDPGPFPEHLLVVPGFIEQVVEHNLKTAHRKQPSLALAAAICLQAVLAGRKIRDYRDNRTNVYVVGVSESGTGKEHARKVNNQAIFQAGAELEGPEELASDTGLVSALENRPAMLTQIDEFGKFLRVLANPQKAPHLYAVIGLLLKLYSSANRIFQGKAYADADKTKTIDQPNLVLYGTGVPGDFFQALTVESLQDGLVGRFLVFEGMQAQREKPETVGIPNEILQTVRWWSKYSPGGNLANVHPEPAVVDTNDEAKVVFEQLGNRIDRGMANEGTWQRSVLSRCEEKACRLALVYAASANHERLVIDGAAARWACDTAEYLTMRLIHLGRSHVSDGAFDALQKRVLGKVVDNGGGITLKHYTHAFNHWDRETRAKVLLNLVETRQLIKRTYKTRTRNGVEYVTQAASSTKLGTFSKNCSESFKSDLNNSKRHNL